MSTKTAERPKPRLSNLDELFKLDEESSQPITKPATIIETPDQPKDTVFTSLPLSPQIHKGISHIHLWTYKFIMIIQSY